MKDAEVDAIEPNTGGIRRVILRSARSSRRSRFAGVAAMVVTVIACLALEGATAAEATPGQRLSDLLATHSLTSLDGRVGRITPATAPASVVHFWASWCGPCKKELPILDDLATELRAKGVRFAAISIDSDTNKARRFVEQHEVSMPVFLDGPDGLAESLALSSIPCTFVLDRAGNVTFAMAGSSEAEIARLRAHLLGLALGDHVVENR